MTPRRALACAMVAAALLAAAPALARDDAETARTVTVQGTGTVSAAPDQAELLLGVVSHAETAGAALRANSAAMAKVMKAIAGFGVAAKDVQTRALALTPLYDNARRPDGGPPRIVGYQASNGLAVTVRALASLGRMIDGLVGEGANRLDGIRFRISEPGALGDEARRRAIADAAHKAALYAKAAGARLGRVIAIAEGGIELPRPVMVRAMKLESASAVPVAPGEQDVTAHVSVTYALE